MTSEPLISAPPAEADASAAELAAAPAERPSKVRWVIFSLACATSFLLYLHRYTWGVVKVELAREFGWDKDALGWLDSAFMLTYAFGQIPGGMLGDWFGPRMVLAAMILLWSAAMGGTAIATGLPGMAGVRLLFGLAQAGCYPNLSKTTKLWFPSSERTAVQGWVASFFGRMGGATSYLLFATVLIGWCHMPWRVALGLFMLLGFAAAVGFLLFFRNSPREHPWVNAAEAHLISDNDPGAATATRSTLKWSTVLRNGSLRALVFQQFTCAYVDNFFSSWIPLFLFEQKHVKLDATGWMSALPMVGGALGGMLAGGMLQNWLILRTGNRRWSRSLIGLTGNLMAMFIMFLSLTLDSATAIAGAFFLLKFFSDWAQPTMWGATTDMGGRNAASIFALVNTAGSLAGFVAGPTMGYTIHAFSGGDATNPTGWTALFVGIGCIYLASALSWLFIDCTQTLEPPAPPPDHAATRMGVP